MTAILDLLHAQTRRQGALPWAVGLSRFSYINAQYAPGGGAGSLLSLWLELQHTALELHDT